MKSIDPKLVRMGRRLFESCVTIVDIQNENQAHPTIQAKCDLFIYWSNAIFERKQLFIDYVALVRAHITTCVHCLPSRFHLIRLFTFNELYTLHTARRAQATGIHRLTFALTYAC